MSGAGETGDLHLPGLHPRLRQNSPEQIPNQTEVPAGPLLDEKRVQFSGKGPPGRSPEVDDPLCADSHLPNSRRGDCHYDSGG
jgi:hypothetical protein